MMLFSLVEIIKRVYELIVSDQSLPNEEYFQSFTNDQVYIIVYY